MSGPHRICNGDETEKTITLSSWRYIQKQKIRISQRSILLIDAAIFACLFFYIYGSNNQESQVDNACIYSKKC